MIWNIKGIVACTLLGTGMIGAAGASAAIKLPGIFSDNMVLQQGIKVPVWGTATPGTKVSVTLDGRTKAAVAGTNGNWRVTFPAHRAGGPAEMVVAGDGELRFRNVLFGEVWVCSGQSNMQWPLSMVTNATAELSAANDPDIRLFTVAQVSSHTPLADCGGAWTTCRPDSTAWFSAVAYFFGRELRQELKVPVGLINSSWGGSAADPWTPLEDLAAEPSLARVYAPDEHTLRTAAQSMEQYQMEMKAWEKLTYHDDPGIAAAAKGWEQPDLPGDGWGDAQVPGRWETTLHLQIDGAVWFRKEIEVPAAWAGRDIVLNLSTLDDYDITFFNGVQVGATGPETTNAWSVPRRYKVPGNLVQAGRAVVAVRVFDRYGWGGFTQLDSQDLAATGPEGAAPQAVALGGDWKYRVELALKPQPVTPAPAAPVSPSATNYAAVLFNGMIHPLIPYGIRGVLWYQGESNTGRAKEYRVLFPTMIQGWRRTWGEGPFPFYFAQLANYGFRVTEPAESTWAELREAQTMTLALPKTGMAVTIDIGEAADIHPRNKQDVGLRLALSALAKTYGRDVVYSGPMFAGMKVKGEKAYVAFKHTDGGLKVTGGQGLKGFAVAGADRRFVWADAAIVGTRVVVSSPAVKAPVAVRYDWGDNPPSTLANGAGLPACPFRTDDWTRPGAN
jgi:sialate O-acetylesterase